jgi:hypothetical protein
MKKAIFIYTDKKEQEYKLVLPVFHGEFSHLREGELVGLRDLNLTTKKFYQDVEVTFNPRVHHIAPILKFNGYSFEQEIDEIAKAKEVLSLAGYMTQRLWCNDDIQEAAKQIGIDHVFTKEECLAIFNKMGQTFNAEQGINWDVIHATIVELFPEFEHIDHENLN